MFVYPDIPPPEQRLDASHPTPDVDPNVRHRSDAIDLLTRPLLRRLRPHLAGTCTFLAEKKDYYEALQFDLFCLLAVPTDDNATLILRSKLYNALTYSRSPLQCDGIQSPMFVALVGLYISTELLHDAGFYPCDLVSALRLTDDPKHLDTLTNYLYRVRAVLSARSLMPLLSHPQTMVRDYRSFCRHQPDAHRHFMNTLLADSVAPPAA
ncbi:MAG: hypothetical protein IJ684_06060 [Bacteroidales bacterium]|nr:hypothetical protein [Bacteroidales bacterium]